MSWAPFALAIVFGLLVSAGIYFTVMWPEVAPDDEADDEAEDEPRPGDGAIGVAPVTAADAGGVGSDGDGGGGDRDVAGDRDGDGDGGSVDAGGGDDGGGDIN